MEKWEKLDVILTNEEMAAYKTMRVIESENFWNIFEAEIDAVEKRRNEAKPRNVKMPWNTKDKLFNKAWDEKTTMSKLFREAIRSMAKDYGLL